MGYRVNNRADDVAFAAVKALNDTRRALVSTNVHADVTPELSAGSYRSPTSTAAAVTSADATNEATLITLTKEILAVYRLHLADDVAHKVKDVANAIAAAEPSSTATCVTALNEIKADLNLHIASTTYHYTADATNDVTSADATNEASAITLANEIKDDLTAHIAAALGGAGVRIVGVAGT